MELSDKDEYSVEKRNVDPLNYHSSDISSDWHFDAINHSNQGMGLVPMNNSIPTRDGDPILWNNIQASKSASENVAFGKGEHCDLGWNRGKENALLQTGGEGLSPTLSELPADSCFIERAARFSCFNGGGFSGIESPYNISKTTNHFSKDELFLANGSKPALGVQSQMNQENGVEVVHDVMGPVEKRDAEGSSIKERKVVGFVRTPDETAKGCNVSYEAGVNCSGSKVEHSMLVGGGRTSASKLYCVKKRKRTGDIQEDTEINRIDEAPKVQGETSKPENEPKQKNDQKPSTTGKATKTGRDSSQNSDASKEDYIHVRARRGQATNSHSLAERVRREKISERMKLLQDLVPGCNKVTGKAVMLDEIINYVQSLQQQVEFLSMKLSTVNPRLDLNIEELLPKDIHQPRGGPSMFPFSPDANVLHTQLRLHPSQQGLIQAGIPSTGNPLDALRRPINPQLVAMNGMGYKDSSQIPNIWDNELNNVFHMNFGTNAPYSGQDLNGSLPSGHMKVEL